MKKLLLLFMGLFVSGYALAQSPTIVSDLRTYAGSDAFIYSVADKKIFARNNLGKYELYGEYEHVNFSNPGYVEVEYIESEAIAGQGNGNAPRILTDYMPKANTRIAMDCNLTENTLNGWEALFGCRDTWQNVSYSSFAFFWRNGDKYTGTWQHRGSADGTVNIPGGVRTSIYTDDGDFYVYQNGTQVSKISAGTGQDFNLPMVIFNVYTRNAQSYNEASYYKLYSFKIYEGETLVRDYVPVVTSNEKGGLLDKLTGNILTSAVARDFAKPTTYAAALADATKGVTTYVGKIVIDDSTGSRYQWNGAQWMNISTRTFTSVENLSTYNGTAPFVYNQADSKYYARNNHNAYEEYGIYEWVNLNDPDYVEVEYIESDPSNTNAPQAPRINTGYIPKTNTRIDMDCYLTENTVRDWECLFGCRAWSNQAGNSFDFFWHNGTNKQTGYWQHCGEGTGTTPIPGNKRTRIFTNGTNGKVLNVYQDGNLISSITGGDGGDCTYPIYIFNVNTDNANFNEASYFKLYSFKIYEGETLVRDYVPIVTKAEKGGLLDRLTGEILISPTANDFAKPTTYAAALTDATKGVTTYPDKMVRNRADMKTYKWDGTRWNEIGDAHATTIADFSTYTGNDQYVYSEADGKFYILNDQGNYEVYGTFDRVNTLKVEGATGELDYIVSTSNGYIQTDYAPQTTTRAVCIADIPATNLNNNNNYLSLFSCDYGNAPFRFYGQVRYGKMFAQLKGTNEVQFDAHVGRKLQYELDAATGHAVVRDMNDVTLSDINLGSPMTGSTTVPLCILGEKWHDNGTGNYMPAGVAFYGMKIYEGSTLVRDYVPYVQDGQVGIFDKVNNTFTAGVNVKAGTIPVYEGKIVCLSSDDHAYKYSNGQWTDQGAITFEPLANTDYKNLKTWATNSAHTDCFAGIVYDATAGTNTITDYRGTGGNEPLATKIAVEPGEHYRYTFNYTNNGTAGHNVWAFRAFVRNGYNVNNGEYFGCIGTDYIGNHLLPYHATSQMPVQIDFTAQQAEETLELQFGAVRDYGANNEPWKSGGRFDFSFDNLLVQKYVIPATYDALTTVISTYYDEPVIEGESEAAGYPDYMSNVTAEIAEVDGKPQLTTPTVTTDILAQTLAQAFANAQATTKANTVHEQFTAYYELKKAYEDAVATNVTILRATANLAQNEGIEATNTHLANAVDFLANGTDANLINGYLTALRTERQRFNIETEASTFAGNAPVAGGKFYFYNVGTGAYLTGGSEWGTHAAIGYPGLEGELIANGNGFEVHFDELFEGNPGARQAYLGSFIDTNKPGASLGGSVFTFEAVEGEEGVYYLKSGNNYFTFDPISNVIGYFNTVNFLAQNGDYSKWKLVTKEQRLAALDNASETNPVDATVAMANASFNKFNNEEGGWYVSDNGGTATLVGQASNGAEGQTWGWTNQHHGDRNVEIYNKQAYEVFQTVTFPRAGIYEVKAQAFYRHGNLTTHAATDAANYHAPAVLFAGDDSTPIVYINEGIDQFPGYGTDTSIGNLPDNVEAASRFFEVGNYWNTLRFVVPEDNFEMKIGIKKEGNDWPANDWVVMDNFRLLYLGPTTMTLTLTNGYATFSAVSNFKITTDGVKAYQATTQDGGQIVMAPLAGVIPANTGVVLFGEGQTSVTLTPTSDAAIDNLTGNMLRPHIERGPVEKESDGCKNYLLTKDPKNAENCIFRPSSGSGNLAANRAYLAVPTGNGAKESFFISFSDDPITGIKTTMNEELRMKDSSAVYDLQGRKVADNPSSLISRPSYKKGVYIVNGKKVVIK